MSDPTVATLTLKPRHALPFFKRHPWVFAGAIRQSPHDLPAGTEVELRSHEGEFVARGLFNPNSQIRVRLYSWEPNQPLDRNFWRSRIDSALQLRSLTRSVSEGERSTMLPTSSLVERSPSLTLRVSDSVASQVTAYRLINSEADCLSGLTVDRYDRWLSVQFTSLALQLRQDEIVELLRELTDPAGILLRTEKGVLEAEGLELRDGLTWGEPPPRPLTVVEHGVRWEVDLSEGQKTGGYLDQRDNRLAVAKYVRGHRLLDVFCYAGGFGITALALGGVSEVVAVDSSEPALALAQRNAEINQVADRWRSERGDAFKVLEQLRDAGELFDTVVLDPPKLTRSRTALPQAMRAYHSLNRLGVSVLKPGGLLVTCSCSGLVTRDDFEQMLGDVAIQSGRTIRILEVRGAAPDHPLSPFCPENEYLKCYICHVS